MECSHYAFCPQKKEPQSVEPISKVLPGALKVSSTFAGRASSAATWKKPPQTAPANCEKILFKSFRQ